MQMKNWKLLSVKLKKGKENKNTKTFILNKDKLFVLKPDKKDLIITQDTFKIVKMEEAHKAHFGL